MPGLNGSVEVGFERVREAFEGNFSSTTALPDIGASFAVIRNDEVLVDLWGGYASSERSRPWSADSVTNVFSTTKGIAAICTTLLESRGELDYGAPVARYWPEFAARGKAGVTVGMLLSHQSGLSGLREPVAIKDLFDHELMVSRLASAEPLWKPGTSAGYHAFTWGYLVAEIVRRVDGRTIGCFLREELCEPLGADVFIGLPESAEPRYAEIVRTPGAQVQSFADMGEIQRLTFVNPLIEAEVANLRAWRAAEIPAAGGCANALGLARLYAPLANGGASRGRELFNPEAIKRALHERFVGIDINLGVPVRWGAGFFGNNPQRWYGPSQSAFGHSGWGGSCAFFDPERKLAIAFAMNQMGDNLQGDPRTIGLINAFYSCLDEAGSID